MIGGFFSRIRGLLAGPPPVDPQVEKDRARIARMRAAERPDYVPGYNPAKDPTGTSSGKEAAEKMFGAIIGRKL